MTQHQRSVAGQLAARGVQFVRMFVMADQHDIDPAEGLGGTGGLGEVGVRTGWIERRVDDDALPGDVDDGRRPAEHAEAEFAALFVEVVRHDTSA